MVRIRIRKTMEEGKEEKDSCIMDEDGDGKEWKWLEMKKE